MPSKNDLSAFKKRTEDNPILPSNEKQEIVTISTKKRIGRPKKKPAEKRNYKITLSLTQGEGAKIAEKAGLASEATYLYALLEKSGAFK